MPFRSWRLAAILGVLGMLLASAAARADEPFGPQRTVLIQQDWGGVYNLPLPPTTVLSRDLIGEYIFRDRGAMTIVQQVGYSDRALVIYPDNSSLTVTVKESKELEIDLRGRKSYFRPNLNGWVLKLPTDEIRLTRRGNEVRISGRFGTTVAVDGSEGFTIKSPSGETIYARASFDEPYRLTGVPVQSHPYVVRGVWFEAMGFGAFLDFKLSEYSRAFSILAWHPMLILEDK